MDERIKILYDFISDFWKIIKKYAALPNNDDEWYALINEAEDLNKKYNGTGGSPEGRFVTKCLVEWMSYLNELEIRRTKGTADEASPAAGH